MDGLNLPKPSSEADAKRRAIRVLTLADESAQLQEIVAACPTLDPDAEARVMRRASVLAERARAAMAQGVLQPLLNQFALSSVEGLALMRLAEAYLRVPDTMTADALIRDTLSQGEWQTHRGQSSSTMVNLGSLALTGGKRFFANAPVEPAERSVLASLATRLGAPVARQAVGMAMRLMGERFVLGEDIKEAMRRARKAEARGFRHSYDMLGEGAATRGDADRHYERYEEAIRRLGKISPPGTIEARPSISIKLSAIHPRFEQAQERRVLGELADRLATLVGLAKDLGIGATVDAEEADRLDLSLSVIERVAASPALRGWDGFGFAIQAYQKRARAVVEWAEDLAQAAGLRLMPRLVKGAYWDTEIKRAQESGLADFPVFTQKAATDVSYLACARAMLASPHLYPAFATHNARTVATIAEYAGDRRDFEFQRLHGMGEGIYEDLVAREGFSCRIYAPVGAHTDLLAYLVRRLLENGANTSFVNQLAEASRPVADLLEDPVRTLARFGLTRHPRIALPRDLFAPERTNSAGLDLSNPDEAGRLEARIAQPFDGVRVSPLIDGHMTGEGQSRMIKDPSDPSRIVGQVRDATPADINRAMEIAGKAQVAWDAVGAERRAGIIAAAGDRIEAERDALVVLLVREAGKTIPDALAEVREAVDFCRYYAARARREFAPEAMPGPTGEVNTLRLAGRGVFGVIAPWNFPLAIFVGQTVAALVAGNAVLAKPAPQTPLIAAQVVRILLDAGVPTGVIHLLPGGPSVGKAVVAHAHLSGVAFTGSTTAAKHIARALADGDGPIRTLIAETGGINAMIVDSTALPEQVVRDVVASGFRSAGQRCSALRLLLLQEDTAERTIEMITGAMDELVLGDPGRMSTDLGPVIEQEARERIEAHVRRLGAGIIHRTKSDPSLPGGWYVPPTLIRLNRPDGLREEIFGPVVHVATWASGSLDQLVDGINAGGFGLTLGLHTRLDAVVERVTQRARVGNLYVNRSTIGAVVGAQPFGGEGLSGTGPKAGGPRYLSRFAVERSVSTDTTAAGGNTKLIMLSPY